MLLGARIWAMAYDLCVRRAEAGEEKPRTCTAFDHTAKSWAKPRRVVAGRKVTAG
jgi:hypothetical protein